MNNLLRSTLKRSSPSSAAKLSLPSLFSSSVGKSLHSAAADFVGDDEDLDICPPSHSGVKFCYLQSVKICGVDRQDVLRSFAFVTGAGRRFSSHITRRLLSSGPSETPSEARPIPQERGIPKARVEAGVGDTLSLEGINTELDVPGEFGRVVILPNEVDINDTLTVSCGASIDKYCSIGIVGRLNKNGAVLFWKVLTRPLVQGYGTNKSDFYETGAVEEGLKAVHKAGYGQHKEIILTNDCNRAVKQINGLQKCTDVKTLQVISLVQVQKNKFDQPKKVKIIGKIPRLKFGVNDLSKVGRDPNDKLNWDSFRQRMSNEAIRFPIQPSEVLPFL